MIPPLALTPPPEPAPAPQARGGDRFAGTLARALANGRARPATASGDVEVDADATASTEAEVEAEAPEDRPAVGVADELAGAAAVIGVAVVAADVAPAAPAATPPPAGVAAPSAITAAVIDAATAPRANADVPTGAAGDQSEPATGPVPTAALAEPAGEAVDAAERGRTEVTGSPLGTGAGAVRSDATAAPAGPTPDPDRPVTATDPPTPTGRGLPAAPRSSVEGTPDPAVGFPSAGSPAVARRLADEAPVSAAGGEGPAPEVATGARDQPAAADAAANGPVLGSFGSPLTPSPSPLTTGSAATSPASGATSLAAADAVRYLRDLAPARAVQRLAVDLDGSMVAVRVDHAGTAPAVRVQVVDDPAGRLDGSWITSVERTLAQSMRREGSTSDADPRRRDQIPVGPDDAATARAAGRRWARALGGER